MKKKSTFVAQHIAGETNLNILECRLRDVENRINNYDGCSEAVLNILKYERILLIKLQLNSFN